MNDCDDPELAAQADLRFHLAIAEASHNLVLLQTMRGFFDLLQSSVLHSRQRMYTQPVIFNQLNAQHQAMFDAVMAGDADAVKGDITILADSGIRNGLDVVRMIALGADSVLLGRAFIYALATHGQRGVENLLSLVEKEMRVAMTLTGAKTIADITQDSLVQANALLSEAGRSPARPHAVR
ncbi:hypothetical protein E05_42450 [Plautia stali symbiont]|nr:hypothetical protein E05_42450 [Plautia stali symbiont]